MLLCCQLSLCYQGSDLRLQLLLLAPVLLLLLDSAESLELQAACLGRGGKQRK